MKRLVNPTVEELNGMYELARNQHKILVEVMDTSNSGIHGWDYLGQPDSNQVIYLLSKKELATWKHMQYDVIYEAAT
jgi:hypothetical protein